MKANSPVAASAGSARGMAMRELLQAAASVDHRRLEQFVRHLAEENREDQHGEGQRLDRMHQDDAELGADESGSLQHHPRKRSANTQHRMQSQRERVEMVLEDRVSGPETGPTEAGERKRG